MPRPSAKDGKDGRNAVARSVHWVISPSLSLSICMYIYIYVNMYIYIYVYIYRDSNDYINIYTYIII